VKLRKSLKSTRLIERLKAESDEKINSVTRHDDDISLLEQQMTNANVSKASTIADTAIGKSVNWRKQNRHRGIKERLQR